MIPFQKYYFRIALFYLSMAAAWILLSDAALFWLAADTARTISIFKGWGYVLVTAYILMILMRREYEKEQAAAARLRKINRLYRVLSDCNQHLIRAESEAELLQQICRILSEMGAYQLAWIGLTEKNGVVRPAARAGAESGYLDKVRIRWDETPEGRGPTGTAIRTAETQIVYDIPNDMRYEPWREAALAHGFSCAIALPIRDKTQVIGALTVYSGEAGAFDAEEIRLLEELAMDVGYGLGALRARTDLYLSGWILQQMPEAIVVSDMKRKITHWAGMAEDLFGYSAEEVVGQYGIELRAPENIEAESVAFQQQFQETGRYAGETMAKRKNGERFPIESSARIVHDLAGNPLAIVEIHRDITERKQAEAALRQSEERLRHIVQNMPVMMDAFDEAGNIIMWNKECERVTGYSAEEIIGNPQAMHLLYPDAAYLETMTKHWLARSDRYVGWEWEITTKDGSKRMISWANISDEFPIPGWSTWGIGVDVTDRVQAQAALKVALQELEQRVQALRDTAVLLTNTLDMDIILDHILANIGRVIPHDAMNIMLLRDEHLQISRAQGYLERGLDIVLFNQRLSLDNSPHVREMQSGQQPILIVDTRQYPGWPEDAERAWVRSYLGTPIVADNQVLGFINLLSSQADFFNEDHLAWLKSFTDQAAIALRNARLYERAGELAALKERQRLANDLHDAVTQTLFSANVLAKTLLRTWEKTPETISDGLTQLNQLTRGALAEMRMLLLELRPEALEESDLDKLLSQLVDAMSSRTDAAIHLEVQGEGEVMPAVKIAFYRMMQEALNNIIKHAFAKQITVQLVYNPTLVTLIIRDNGRGFEVDHVAGDHLGLKIMHERALAIDAALTIISQPGQGTEIQITWKGET
jgi:two-component system nitrate/nitrite sensor histidine kinase NarX